MKYLYKFIAVGNNFWDFQQTITLVRTVIKKAILAFFCTLKWETYVAFVTLLRIVLRITSFSTVIVPIIESHTFPRLFFNELHCLSFPQLFS